MPKLFLVVTLLMNLINVSNEFVTIVEKIEYTADNYNNNILKLKIVLNSSSRDIVKLKIFFYDKNGELINDNYYSSALEIEGIKETYAKVPVVIEDKMFLNIVLTSDNHKKEIENIMFPIYPKDNMECDLNASRICKSKHPSVVVYNNKVIDENYEMISLVNTNLNIDVFNNLIPLNKMKIITNSILIDGYSSLSVDEDIGLESISLPLNIMMTNNIINFELANKYYLDVMEGKVYDNYKEKTIYDNQIILPYENKIYKITIELYDCFKIFNYVKIDFNVTTKDRLIGDCNLSKYCIRRNYL